MYQQRRYLCLSCKKEFTLTDGIISHQESGESCPHCGSNLTVELPHERITPPRDE